MTACWLAASVESVLKLLQYSELWVW